MSDRDRFLHYTSSLKRWPSTSAAVFPVCLDGFDANCEIAPAFACAGDIAGGSAGVSTEPCGGADNAIAFVALASPPSTPTISFGASRICVLVARATFLFPPNACSSFARCACLTYWRNVCRLISIPLRANIATMSLSVCPRSRQDMTSSIASSIACLRLRTANLFRRRLAQIRKGLRPICVAMPHSHESNSFLGMFGEFATRVVVLWGQMRDTPADILCERAKCTGDVL